jgi:hypothetical protein
VSDADLTAEDFDDDEDDGDWRDYDDDGYEPDPEDAGIARSYEEYWEHRHRRSAMPATGRHRERGGL